MRSFAERNDMAKKQSSSKLSTLASKVLSGEHKPTQKEIKELAASVLGQDETKGKGVAKTKDKGK